MLNVFGHQARDTYNSGHRRARESLARSRRHIVRVIDGHMDIIGAFKDFMPSVMAGHGIQGGSRYTRLLAMLGPSTWAPGRWSTASLSATSSPGSWQGGCSVDGGE